MASVGLFGQLPGVRSDPGASARIGSRPLLADHPAISMSSSSSSWTSRMATSAEAARMIIRLDVSSSSLNVGIGCVLLILL